MVVDNNSNDHKLCPQTTFFVLMFWLRDHFLHLHWVHPKICCIWQCSWMSGRRNMEINLEVYPWTQTWQDLVFQLFILFNACVWRECWHLRKRWFTEVWWHRSFGKKINEIPTYMQVLGLDDAIVYQENSTKVKGCVCVYHSCRLLGPSRCTQDQQPRSLFPTWSSALGITSKTYLRDSLSVAV